MLKRILTRIAPLALLAAPAWPQSAELGISAGYGSLGGGDISTSEFAATATQATYSLRNGVRVGGRMGFNSFRFVSHEASYSYQHGGLDFLASGPDGSQAGEFGTVRAHHLYYNALLHAAPAGFRVRPFVTGGGGFSSFFLPGISSFSGGGETKFGYNYGGGIKLDILQQYGIRLDVRNHVTGKPFDRYLPNVEGTLQNTEFSVTFYVLLG